MSVDTTTRGVCRERRDSGGSGSVVVADWSRKAISTDGWYDDVARDICKSCDGWLMGEIMGSVKLWMLQSRIRHYQPQRRTSATGSFSPKGVELSRFRNYLGLGSPDSRRALTRLVFSDHHLSIETLRKSDGQHRPRIPRE